MDQSHHWHFPCCQAASLNKIRTSGLVPVLTAKLVTTASATKLLPHKHPLAQTLFFCPSFFFRQPLTTPRPFSLILRECTSPCCPAKSNHVSLSTPQSWLTNAFSSKGQILQKSHPAISSLMPFVLSLYTHSLCLLLLPLPRGCYFFSDQPQHGWPSGVLIRSAATQSMDGSSYFLAAWRSSICTVTPFSLFFPNMPKKLHI